VLTKGLDPYHDQACPLEIVEIVVVWNMAFMNFHILGIIIPTDQYFLQGLKPPTRYYF